MFNLRRGLLSICRRFPSFLNQLSGKMTVFVNVWFGSHWGVVICHNNYCPHIGTCKQLCMFFETCFREKEEVIL